MAATTKVRTIHYPTSDGKLVAETDVHIDNLLDLRQVLKALYVADPTVYVAGNMLLYYAEGEPRKHVAPDVFVVFGVPNRQRDNFLVWQEGKGPDVIFELTSKSTRNEDLKKKLVLYRDVLKVKEYFLFDPKEEYLKPSMQGFRLVDGDYVPIQAMHGRLPSEVLGVHLERDGSYLRLFDPKSGQHLPMGSQRVVQELAQAENENARLRREIEALRSRLNEPKPPA